MARGGHHAGERFAFADFVVPDDFAGFVVQRAQRGITPEILIAATPAFYFSIDGAVVNAEQPMS